jgi:hypothetical protein
MRNGLFSGARRLAASASIATAVTALTAGSALAAGTGYGSPQPSNGLPPSGFTSVITVKTLGERGGAVSGKSAGGRVIVVVPRGAGGRSLQVALTKGSGATVKNDLSGALRKDKILVGFGVELRHGSSPAFTQKPLIVSFNARDLHSGDVVVAFNPKTRKFVRIQASVRSGKVVVRIKRSESVAVLAPKRK